MEKNNRKILVVDDDRGIGRMLKMLLEMNGYKVFLSEEPEKTEEYISAHNIDLVLLDMLISGVNGIDVCTRLRRDEITRNIPIIMMSALHNAGERCRAAGANDFFSKPFELEELLEKVNKSYKSN